MYCFQQLKHSEMLSIEASTPVRSMLILPILIAVTVILTKLSITNPDQITVNFEVNLVGLLLTRQIVIIRKTGHFCFDNLKKKKKSALKDVW